jgi:hypothetical protein
MAYRLLAEPKLGSDLARGDATELPRTGNFAEEAVIPRHAEHGRLRCARLFTHGQPLSAGADTSVMKNIAQLVDHNHRFPLALSPLHAAAPRRKKSSGTRYEPTEVRYRTTEPAYAVLISGSKGGQTDA